MTNSLEEDEQFIRPTTAPSLTDGPPPSLDCSTDELSSSSVYDSPAASFSHHRGTCCQRTQILASQLSLSELSGSMGDLGTLIPLFVALGRQRAIYVAPALFLAGSANVLTGFFWDVPMPVQPMKAIAAMAIAAGDDHQGLNRNQVTAAGMWMGLFMVFFGATNSIEGINKIVPLSVVAGVQLGVGMSLAIHGIQMIVELPFWSSPDCILAAISAGLATVYCLRHQHGGGDGDGVNSSSSSRLPPPIGLFLLFWAFILGMVNFALDGSSSASSSASKWSWEPCLTWTLSGISPKEWLTGLWEGAVPQLPLTTLNSVISVCTLAHTLFPEKRQAGRSNDTIDCDQSFDAVLSRREVAMSVGILNLLTCPLGGMPICHGAGGLAGQHKLGARHGASIVFLGCLKMILATTMGATVMHMLDAFPISVLGVMLVMAGHELALTGLWLSMGVAVARGGGSSSSNNSNSSEQPRFRPTDGVGLSSQNETTDRLASRSAITLLTAIVILGTKKTHYGAIAGLIADWIQRVPQPSSALFGAW